MKKRKYINILLVAVILVNMFANTMIKVNAVETTTIDLTGLATGAETNHDCSKYLVNKSDNTHHWQVCSICSTQYGTKVVHSYTSKWTMGDSCSSSNKLLYTCSCGHLYSTENTRAHTLFSYLSYNSRYHVRLCTVCLAEIQEWALHSNSSGIVNCANPGTCSTCGVYISNIHEAPISNWDGVIGSGNCINCNKSCFNVSGSSSTVSYSGTTFTVTNRIHIPTINGTPNSNNARFYVSQYGTITGTSSSWDATNKILTTVFTGYYAANIETKDQAIVYEISYTDIYGASYNIPVWNYIVPEKTAPTINNIEQTNLSTQNGWATGKILTFSGTEEYCGAVKLTLKDSAGNVYLNNVSALVSNGSWSYVCIPNIEADANEKTFILTVADTLGNTSTKTFTVYKTDRKSPTMTSNSTTSTEWSKTKNYRVSGTDSGVGAVSIGFNSTNEYQYANLSGLTYYRDYILTGDVYSEDGVKVAIYLKDGLGNETTKYITVYKLDNTAPTVEISKSFSKGIGTITINANDEHETLGEGSGITGYAMTTTNTTPTTYQENNVFTVTENGTYYVWVTDAVGNVTSKEIKIVELEYDINTNTQIGGIISNNCNKLTYGETTSVFIIPMDGYEIADVIVDGVSVGIVSTYDFWDIESDHTVIATFKRTDGLEQYLEALANKYYWIDLEF